MSFRQVILHRAVFPAFSLPVIASFSSAKKQALGELTTMLISCANPVVVLLLQVRMLKPNAFMIV